MKFCEFIGDDESPHDGFKKKKCEYLGWRSCVLHKEPLSIHEGWRVCCESCTTPIQVKQLDTFVSEEYERIAKELDEMADWFCCNSYADVVKVLRNRAKAYRGMK